MSITGYQTELYFRWVKNCEMEPRSYCVLTQLCYIDDVFKEFTY